MKEVEALVVEEGSEGELGALVDSCRASFQEEDEADIEYWDFGSFFVVFFCHYLA